MTYKNGFEFWRDLLIRHGRQEARGIANRYLDMQSKNTDPAEMEFCRQLYTAMI